MGQFLIKIGARIQDLFKKQEARILFMGLDAAGKTSILYMLKLGEVVTTIPTIGFNRRSPLETKNLTFQCWDLGGESKIRELWPHYYSMTNVVIFVIDSRNRERFDEAYERRKSDRTSKT